MLEAAGAHNEEAVQEAEEALALKVHALLCCTAASLLQNCTACEGWSWVSMAMFPRLWKPPRCCVHLSSGRQDEDHVVHCIHEHQGALANEGCLEACCSAVVRECFCHFMVSRSGRSRGAHRSRSGCLSESVHGSAAQTLSRSGAS